MSHLKAGPMSDAETTPRRRKVWQFGTQTLLLLVALVAVWFTVWTNLRRIQVLEARIEATIPLARELVIDDPLQFAVVKKDERWYDENQWVIHVPPGRFRLCVATHEVDGQGLAPVARSVPVPEGRHEVSLEQRPGESSWRIAVTLDGAEAMSVEEPKAWDPGVSSIGGGRHERSSQYAVSRPLGLFRRRFSQPDAKGTFTTPTGPANGILLWIEADPDAAASPR